MPAAVYSGLYDRVKTAPDLDILEIGPYRGASTIAMAWAMQDSGKKSRIVTVEKADGGQWHDPGHGHSENIAVLTSNLARQGVADRVTVFPDRVTDENRSEIVGLLGTDQLAALVHDADGHIDRDFRLFWRLVRPGGLIVIDDYRETPEKFQRPDERRPQGGIKGPLTFRLLNQFIEWGLFEPDEVIGETIFGSKPVGADFARFDQETCDAIHRSVIRDRDAHLDGRGM